MNPAALADVAQALLDDPDRRHTADQLATSTGHPRSSVGLALWHLTDLGLISTRPLRGPITPTTAGQLTYRPTSSPEHRDQLHQIARGPAR